MTAPRQVPHVMHVIDSLACGGAERMLVDLANATRADGHAVSVCVTRQGLQMCSALDSRIPVTELGRRRRFEIGAVRRFARLVQRTGATVLHVHGRSSFSFVALAKCFRMVRAGVLLHDHSTQGLEQAAPAWLTRWGRHYLSTYVGVCKAQADWAESKAMISSGNVHCIMNRMDLSRFAEMDQQPCLSQMEGRQRLSGVLVGGIRPEKGIDVLIEAVAQSRCRSQYEVTVVGGDRDESYSKRCWTEMAALGLSDSIRFMGESKDVPQLLSSADFGLISSRKESGPLVLIEYLASGLPVVATCVGQVTQTVVNAGLVSAVPPEDPAALARAIDKIVEMTPDQRRQLGLRGRSFALDRFEIRQVMSQWYSLYQRTAGMAV